MSKTYLLSVVLHLVRLDAWGGLPMLVAAAALLIFNAGSSADASTRPNFLFILVDDLGYSDVGCYGNTLHETPNVDGLAKEGMRFTSAYAACAVCSPTRASIQTGQYPIRFGITDWIPGHRKRNARLKEEYTATFLPHEATTLPESLQQYGYRTAFLGKWHLNAEGQQIAFPEDHGYDVNIGGHHKGSPPGGYFAPFENPKLADRPDDDYLTDRLGDEAANLIAEFGRDSARPFFMMLAFYTVHKPIQPKPELEEHYAAKLSGSDSHWKNPGYAAMVHSMDQNVGKVLAALRRSGLEENTVVIFFSDNGGLGSETNNFPLRLGKGYYHEGGIRVPLIFRYPSRVPADTTCYVPMISSDFFPTILELAGAPLEPQYHRDGVSLLPLLKGRSTLERDAIYWHYPHYHGAGETPASAIRCGDFKFIRHYEDGRRELYDLSKDIGEQQNLVQQLPETASRLERKLDEWLDDMDAYIPVPEPSHAAGG